MDNKRKVLLCGPRLQNKNALYGGGIGGYTRNMAVYLKYFNSDEFLLVPCFQTTRNKKLFKVLQFPVRLVNDLYFFILCLIKEKPSIVHIMGQYRSAITREFFLVALSKLFRKKVIYEIKAGGFIKFYCKTNFFKRSFTKYILHHCETILAEGEIYIDFINNITKTNKCYYFPNFVPSDEVPDLTNSKFKSTILNVLFVGYCYEGKGIFELVSGLSFCAKNGGEIKLTIVGEESPEFKTWIDDYNCAGNLTIIRLGKLPHSEVLRHMSLNDVYFYPTKHSGEGHNNSINEAMMSFMTIVTTKTGFLTSVLADSAYFLDEVNDQAIDNVVRHIITNKHEAIEKATKARKRLVEYYTSFKQIPILNSYYKIAFKS